MKDWIVREIVLSADAKKFGENSVQYPYHVRGLNLNGNEEFAWGLPAKFWDNPRYDMSGITRDERCAAVSMEVK